MSRFYYQWRRVLSQTPAPFDWACRVKSILLCPSISRYHLWPSYQLLGLYLQSPYYSHLYFQASLMLPIWLPVFHSTLTQFRHSKPWTMLGSSLKRIHILLVLPHCDLSSQCEKSHQTSPKCTHVCPVPMSGVQPYSFSQNWLSFFILSHTPKTTTWRMIAPVSRDLYFTLELSVCHPSEQKLKPGSHSKQWLGERY